MARAWAREIATLRVAVEDEFETVDPELAGTGAKGKDHDRRFLAMEAIDRADLGPCGQAFSTRRTCRLRERQVFKVLRQTTDPGRLEFADAFGGDRNTVDRKAERALLPNDLIFSFGAPEKFPRHANPDAKQVELGFLSYLTALRLGITVRLRTQRIEKTPDAGSLPLDRGTGPDEDFHSI
jgi:hypothetical protein